LERGGGHLFEGRRLIFRPIGGALGWREFLFEEGGRDANSKIYSIEKETVSAKDAAKVRTGNILQKAKCSSVSVLERTD